MVSWGGRLHLFGVEWQKWMSAATISAFLAFFPISVGALRGLLSPAPAAVERLQGAVRDRVVAAIGIPPDTVHSLRPTGGGVYLNTVGTAPNRQLNLNNDPSKAP